MPNHLCGRQGLAVRGLPLANAAMRADGRLRLVGTLLTDVGVKLGGRCPTDLRGSCCWTTMAGTLIKGLDGQPVIGARRRGVPRYWRDWEASFRAPGWA